MRLAILDHGHGAFAKALLSFVRLVSRGPAPDALKLVMYRPEFYGREMKALTHEAMRGASAWTVAEREIMAAAIAKSNSCEFCTKAHSAVAIRACGDEARVTAALDDAADVSEPLKSTLRMLRKLALDGQVGTDDMRVVLAAGATRQQVMDALSVSFAFNVTSRLAEAFDFAILDRRGFETGAKILLRRGYR